VVPAAADKATADLVTRLVHASGWTGQKKLDAARKFLVEAKKDPVLDRVHCLLSVAVAALDQDNADEVVACARDALNLLSAKDSLPRDAKNVAWLFLGWARLASEAHLSSQAAAFTAAIKKDYGLQAQAALEAYRAEIKAAKELADDSWSKAVPDKTTLAHAQALELFARFKAGQGGGSALVETIDGLEPERIRPLGYAGVALGAQDKAR
jgi:hypothetical protein